MVAVPLFSCLIVLSVYGKDHWGGQKKKITKRIQLVEATERTVQMETLEQEEILRLV